jgi:hypothetical protein
MCVQAGPVDMYVGCCVSRLGDVAHMNALLLCNILVVLTRLMIMSLVKLGWMDRWHAECVDLGWVGWQGGRTIAKKFMPLADVRTF